MGSANKMALDPNNRDAQNVLEAASSGAAVSVNIIANIVANLIAFLAVLAFINATFSWLGDMVNIQGLSFQVQPRPARTGWGVGGGQSWVVGSAGQPAEPRPARVPAAPLALCLSSSAPTSCARWLS